MSLELNTPEIQAIKEQFRQEVTAKKIAIASSLKITRPKLTHEQKQELAAKRK